MAKNTYYFKHDSNAVHDPKIKDMRFIYKMEGYGVYWAFIETFREQEGYKLPIGKYTYQSMAEDLHVDEKWLLKYVDDCINEFRLFQRDDHFIWSDSLIRRMQTYEKRADLARELSNRRWHTEPEPKSKPAVKPQPVKPQPALIPKESNKDDGKKVYGCGQNVKLTEVEFNKLVEMFGREGAFPRIDKLSTYIGSKGDKYKSHYMTILNWENRDKEQGNGGNHGTGTNQPDNVTGRTQGFSSEEYRRSLRK